MKPKKPGVAAVFLRGLVNAVATGLENRLLIPWFGVRLFRVQRPPPVKEPKRWFNGAVRHYGAVVECDDVLIDFSLLERGKKHKGDGKKYSSYFEKGFLCVGGMASPPQGRNLSFGENKLNTWTPAQGKPVAADVVHQEAVVLLDIYFGSNPALLLRQMYKILYYLESLNVDIPCTTLLLVNYSPQGGGLDEIATRLFNVRHIKDLHGVHLFRKFLCFVPGAGQGWQHRDASELLRRYMFPAFGLPCRRRSQDVNRITLVSRQDYNVDWGLNMLTRKIGNEDEIVEVLRRNFPAAEVRAVRLEQLPVGEQLKLVGETDVLIGMHGAALGYAALLPENAALLELFPLWFRKEHYFTTFYFAVVNSGVHYRRWINLNPRREYASEEWEKKRTEYLREGMRNEPKRDFVSVPPRAVLRRVSALRRQILRGAG